MHDLSVSVLGSGSSGNSVLVTRSGSSVLVDAGFSCRELERRLSLFGAEPTQIDAVLLTHEHTDHIRGVKRFCIEHQLPLYATRGTLALTPYEGVDVKKIAAGVEFNVNGMTVRPFKVRHLAAEPVAYSIRTGSSKVGIASDLGCVTQDVVDEMSGSNIMLIEANYDERMLLAGDYPDFLKRTIRSDHGHLSNDDAAMLSQSALSEETERVVLVHLSRENNTPELARKAVQNQMKGAERVPKVEVVEHGDGGGPY